MQRNDSKVRDASFAKLRDEFEDSCFEGIFGTDKYNKYKPVYSTNLMF